MIDRLAEILKRVPLLSLVYRIPGVGRAYHFLLAFAAGAFYGFPGEHMTVIGVTGTKGKTTTAYLISKLLNAAGIKTGLISTVLIGTGDDLKPNTTKQTMLGRFHSQRILKGMLGSGCKVAIVETSSEGILQHRHRFLGYKIAVFTNLSPEHIERHGSFEAYREAKIRLFELVSKRKDGVGIYNLDDEQVGFFLVPRIVRRYGYFMKRRVQQPGLVARQISGVVYAEDETKFVFDGKEFSSQLIGEPNVYNAAASLTVAAALGVGAEALKTALPKIPPPPGRLSIFKDKGVTVIVDYAHEPVSLEALYKTARIFKPKRLTGILGAQGGGRDVWKRAAMGKVAGNYCDQVVLTNEDPYDEDPMSIIRGVQEGVENPKTKVVLEIDREKAIREAVLRAKKSEVVVISGKGGEVWMCVARGKKVPWRDEEIVKKSLKEK